MMRILQKRMYAGTVCAFKCTLPMHICPKINPPPNQMSNNFSCIRALPCIFHVCACVVLTLDSRCCLTTVALAWTSGCWAFSSSSFPFSLPLPLLSFSSSSSLSGLSSTGAADEAGAAVDRTLRRSASPPARAAAALSSTDRGELLDDEDEEIGRAHV